MPCNRVSLAPSNALMRARSESSDQAMLLPNIANPAAITTIRLLLIMLTSLCTCEGRPFADRRSDHDPSRLQQCECDEADHSRRRYEPRVVHVPPEQSRHRRRDESREPSPMAMRPSRMQAPRIG